MAHTAVPGWADCASDDLRSDQLCSLDSGVLIVSPTSLEAFVQRVADDHALATGIKPLQTHYDIVDYATKSGYDFSFTDWARHLALDALRASDDDLDQMLRADPLHWSWAFRQLSTWRNLLMDGAASDGLRPCLSAASPAAVVQPGSESEQDSALEAFIAVVKQQPELKARVKSARNQDEVIELAESLGYSIDSLTLLRRWSQVSDFSKPTWFGWFDD